MTAHEVFVSLFWLVAAGYLTYLVWFVITSVTGRRRGTAGGTAGGTEDGDTAGTRRAP